ncbi:MAG: hypothetical protein QNK37_16325 [Acidobacteriota bacterium]|nr:hypothetical protein [Acidobacteriota bacterium]
MKKVFVAALTALFFLPTLTAAEAAKFLRFEMVETSNETPTEVKLRIPLSLLAAFTEKIDEAVAEVELNDQDIDFKAVWDEVRAAGPNEYLEINSEDTYLKVTTTETHVKVDATGDNGEAVTASFPLALGDLLFSYGDLSSGDLLNELAQMTGQDLLTLEGDTVSARAWVE